MKNKSNNSGTNDFEMNGSKPNTTKFTTYTDRPSSRGQSGRLSSLRFQETENDSFFYPKSPTLVSEKTYTAYTRSSRSSRPSTSKTFVSNQSVTVTKNMSTPTSQQQRKTDKDSVASLRKMEPAFLAVTRDIPGLQIWRLEEKTRVLELHEKDHGFFHEGAAYIVLMVDEEENTSLHYWTGQQCPEGDAATVESKAHDLDRILNNASVFSKETQGHESSCFLRLFPDGIIYIESKPKTTIKRASSYSKRMYNVTGRKYTRAICVEPCLEMLESTSACILDGFPRIYVWIGSSCSYVKRVKAIQMAKKIRNMQRSGTAHIVVIDEKDESMNNAFLKKLHNGENTKKEKVSEGECKGSERTELVLHRVGGDKVMYDMPEAAKIPLKQCYLVRRDSYLLDAGPNKTLYVWVGSQANESAISNGLMRGMNFCEHKGYPSRLSVCRISEDREPVDFKKNFCDWKEKETKNRQLTKRYNIGNIERALFCTKDQRTICKMDELWSDDILNDSDPVTESWKVVDDELESIPWDQQGIFSNGQCYVILSRVDNQSCQNKVLYYWLGSKSTSNLQSKTIELALTMNETLDYHCTLVQVLDGKEPQHFMAVLQNSIIVYDDDLEKNNSQTTKMYCIREIGDSCMRVQQVYPSSSSLNSSASFVLITPNVSYLWYGKKSGSPEREYAKNMLGFLNPASMYNFEVATENKEGVAFWNIIGKKETYPCDFCIKKLERRPPRLVYCGVLESHKFSFTSIDDFTQEDLSEEDIFILDTFDQIYVWVGKSVEESSRKLLPLISKEYINLDPAGRISENVYIWFTAQNYEPYTFTKHFQDWDRNGYGGDDLYLETRKIIRQENAKINVEREMVDRSYIKCPKYPYKELLKKELPEDVNELRKENHLSEKQFQANLKLSRSEFYRLPLWKQDQILKSARLRHVPMPTAPLQLPCSTT